jgi:hypothetical protein
VGTVERGPNTRALAHAVANANENCNNNEDYSQTISLRPVMLHHRHHLVMFIHLLLYLCFDAVVEDRAYRYRTYFFMYLLWTRGRIPVTDDQVPGPAHVPDGPQKWGLYD